MHGCLQSTHVRKNDRPTQRTAKAVEVLGHCKEQVRGRSCEPRLHPKNTRDAQPVQQELALMTIESRFVKRRNGAGARVARLPGHEARQRAGRRRMLFPGTPGREAAAIANGWEHGGEGPPLSFHLIAAWQTQCVAAPTHTIQVAVS